MFSVNMTFDKTLMMQFSVADPGTDGRVGGRGASGGSGGLSPPGTRVYGHTPRRGAGGTAPAGRSGEGSPPEAEAYKRFGCLPESIW